MKPPLLTTWVKTIKKTRDGGVQLWILRHGRAEPYSSNDAARALTEKGRAQVAEVISRQRPQIETRGLVIWTSPYLRARQTAAIAAGLLDCPIARETDLLLPEAGPGQLLEAIYRCASDNILLASHQPLVSSLLDYLCGRRGEEHDMKTASLAAVHCEVAAADLGQLQWLVHP